MKDEEKRNPRNQRTLEPERAWEDQEETEVVTRTINVIAGGFVGGGTTKSVRKKNLQQVLSMISEKMKKSYKPLSTPEIVFSSSDLEGIILGHDDAMIISIVLVNVNLKRVSWNKEIQLTSYFKTSLKS